MSRAPVLEQLLKSPVNNVHNPVDQFVANFSNNQDMITKPDTRNNGSATNPKSGFEHAHIVPNQSMIDKVINLHFNGSLADFQAGIGTCCDIKVSADHNSNAKLFLMQSNLVTMQNSADFPIGVSLPNQSTNTEFLYSSANMKSEKTDKLPKQENNPISFIIPANTHTTVAVNVPVYDRKQSLDPDEARHWIGFNFSDLANEFIYSDLGQGVAIIKHSNERPSPIVRVLEEGAARGEYTPGKLLPSEWEGVASCILSTADASWGLKAIQQAFDNAPFADLSKLKASIHPITPNNSWVSTNKNQSTTDIGANIYGGVTKFGEMLDKNQKISVSAQILNRYVVCNNNIDGYNT